MHRLFRRVSALMVGLLALGMLVASPALAKSRPALAAGQYSTLALRADGTVVGCGRLVGYGAPLESWTEITGIAGGGLHSVGLRSDGAVAAFGLDSYGECDVSGWRNVTSVAAGLDHTVAARSDGSAVATGDNSRKQCNVSGWTGITSVAAGYWHSIGLRSDGTVVRAGSSQGDVSGWSDIVAIAAGGSEDVGLKSDGTVVAAGYGFWGECDVSSWADITAVAAGSRHTVGLRSDGTVVATGENGLGQCNVSGWTDIVAIAAGESHTVGLRSDGTVVATGDNSLHQCEVSDWYVASSSADISQASIDGIGARYVCTGSPIEPAPSVVVAGRTLVAGDDYTVTFSDNTQVGTATVTVAGRGSYSGTVAREFGIGLGIEPTTAIIRVGETLAPAVIGASDPTQWSSSDTDVACVSIDGIVTGVHPGSTMVVARRGDWSATCTVNVADPTLDAGTLSIRIGEDGALNVIGGYGTITWSSSKRSVATVSASGVVHGVAAGVAYITAVCDGVTMTCEVIVGKRDYRLSVSRGVSGTKGYIYVGVKSWTGHALHKKRVKIYRDGAYLGSVKTDSQGKARLRVSKRGALPFDYEARVAADRSHVSGSVVRTLRFATEVYLEGGYETLSGSVYLKKGTYWIWVLGDGTVSGRVGSIRVQGPEGTYRAFKVLKAGRFSVEGSTSSAGGFVGIAIDRLL